MKRQHIFTKRTTIILSQIALMVIFAFHNFFVVPAQADNLQQEITSTAVSSLTPTVTVDPNPTFSWLSTPPEPKFLASSRSLVFLAGEMIFHGLVDASSCADNGLINATTASPCGEAVARNAVILWQNQFDSEILNSSIRAGIPTFMLKNVIIQESHFWPANFPTVYGYPEVGLGHVTEMGADTLLRWDDDFYASFCTTVYSSDTCKKPYIYLPRDQQVTLRGAIMQGLDADCGGCLGGIDLPSAHDSIYLIAKVLHANYNYVEWMLGNITNRQVPKSFEQTDLWRFTLTSYNAGPGCLRSAIYQTQRNGGKLIWKDVSRNFDKGCEGAVDYVDAVTNVYLADPQALEAALSDNSKASQLVFALMGLITPTLASTVSEQPLPSTPTPESTPTSLSSAETTTVTTTPNETVTPVLPSETPIPTVTATIEATPASEIIQPAPISNIPENRNTNEIVVKFNGLVPSFIANAVVDATGGQVEGQVDALDLVVIEVAAEQTSQVLEELQNNLLVEYAEPNYTLGVFYTPNDPGYLNQTYLADMQIPEAWDISTGQGVIVAVIDTGVDVTHPDLASNIWMNTGETGLDANGTDKRSNSVDDDNNGYIDDWQGWNFVEASNNVIDANGHGTHGAGIIAAQMDNGMGIAGIAPSAQIMSLKALDDTGYGTYAGVAEAIIYAVDNGSQVINLGFGGTANSEALLAAVDYAYSHNVTVVAATGNTGTNAVFYPAAFDNVIAVSALDNSQTIASFSTFNEFNDLAAPGVGIYSTTLDGSYVAMSGTSMSSAEISGIAALLASQADFDTAAKIHDALVGSAQDLDIPGWDPYYGNGLVRALDALNFVLTGIHTPTYTPDTAIITSTPGSGDGISIMAVGAGTAWTNINATAPGNQSGTVASTGTFTAGAGTNRILLVGVICELGNAQAMTTLTATYGGVALTPLATTHTSANREHVWVGYLLDSQIPAGVQSVAVTYNTGAGTTLSSLDVKAATYTGVDQTTPFNGSNANFSAGTTVATNAAITYVVNGQTFYVAGNGGNNATETITATPALTEINRNASANQTSFAGGSAVHGAGGTYGIGGISITFAGATSNRSALVVGTLNPAPVNTPTLTSPTGTSITDTTATLGANITNQGASTIIARGTCWGISATPATNCVAEGGTAIGIFTQARTGLPAGTLVYYRGYATNSFGTGYSPDGSFYTEPANQASGVTFNLINATSMTVNWTRGSGTGVIVLMKAASSVNSNPADGTYTTYIANTAFGTGTQIGAGNYVIFKGSGTSVTVTGLTTGTAYYVAVYEYAGAVDTAGVNQGTNYKLTPATGSQIAMAPPLIQPPVVAISLPANNTSFVQGKTVVFWGSATIPDSGNISSSLTWISSIDGTIGSGAGFGISNLSVGTHTITASVTDVYGRVVTTSITVTISASMVDPHGAYMASTDKCAACHRSHTNGSERLIGYCQSPLTSNNFCLNCHSGASPCGSPIGPVSEKIVSTHSNIDWPGNSPSRTEPAQFELLCIQCHNPHGSSNLASVRPDIHVRQSPLIATGPVVFTSQTSADSFDELPANGLSVDDICVTCHVNPSNPGFPMVNHSDGVHLAGADYRGQDCINCHPHSLDTSAQTRDGFMTGCRACHSATVNRTSAVGTRRQIVGASGGDFTRSSHHVVGNDAITDYDCQVCHEMTQHKQGRVRLYNVDTPATVYVLNYTFTPTAPTQTDSNDYEAFCSSCHDSNGRAGDTTPFSDNKPVPVVSTLWGTARHNGTFTTFLGSCLDCHNSGHGSNKLKLLAPWNFTGSAAPDQWQQEEKFCFNCHTTTPGRPVFAAFNTWTNTATSIYEHDVSVDRGLDHDKEVYGASFANRHVECGDCHGPHKDAYPNTATAPAIKLPQRGATGVQPTWPVGGGMPTGFNFLSQATNEYQVCFKCHSSYTTLPGYSPTGLGKLAAAAQQSESRDLAREFNPSAGSFHPVTAQGTNATFPNTWTAGAMCGGLPCSTTPHANRRVFCTDCHANANGAAGGNNGPHGSPRLHILKGTVDYITNDNNNQITHNAGEVCFLCHSYSEYVTNRVSSRFTRHTSNNHDNFPCYDCHDSHGADSNQGLVNFNASHITFPNATYSTSQTAWQRTTNGGTCYVLCHGKDHSGGESYP